MKISEILRIDRGVTSIIGGGGKTTLMLTLARELISAGTVIICTSTRIMPPEDVVLVTDEDPQAISEAVAQHRLICVSEGTDERGKLKPPAIDIAELASMADYVICEADGAKRLPLKAHAEHEPVIPESSGQVVLVVGADGIGKPISEVCHRPEIYARLAGVRLEGIKLEGVKQTDKAAPEIIAAVIEEEKLGTKLLINKVESDELWTAAKRISELVSLPTIAGSIWNGEYRCL